MAASITLASGLGVLSYDDQWWDIAVLSFLASIAAFVLGIIAIRKNKESSLLVYASTLIGLLSLLFIFLHSLFIAD